MTELECAGRTIRMARRTTFGPNFVLEAFLRGPIDKATGLLINLIDIDRILKQVVARVQVSAAPEILAVELYNHVNSQLPTTFPGVNLRLDKVRLIVSEDLAVEYGV